MRGSVLERFMDKVVIRNDGCWEWTGCCNDGGYGLFRNGKMRSAHIVSYEQYVGLVPDGLELHHTCFREWCVCPWHLEPVTHQQNCAASRSRHPMARRTHCLKRNHPLTPENVGRDHRGHRYCRKCRRIANRQSRERVLA